MNTIRYMFCGAAIQSFCASLLGGLDMITISPAQQLGAGCWWLCLIWLSFLVKDNDEY